MKLFWKEVKETDCNSRGKFGKGTLWESLDKVNVDTEKLEHLFESKAKELISAKVNKSVCSKRQMYHCSKQFGTLVVVKVEFVYYPNS